jgi:uncharacterized membrane protein YkoI
MLLPLRIPLLLLSCLAFSAAPLWAQVPEEREDVVREEEMEEEEDDEEDEDDERPATADDFRAGLAKARISLAEAVLRANRVVAGDVLAAHLDVERDDDELEVEFQVMILRDGEIWEVEVDAVSGWVDEIEKMGLLDEVVGGEEDDDDEDDEDEHEHGEEHGHGEKHEQGQIRPAPVVVLDPLNLVFEDMSPGSTPKGFAVAETNGTNQPAAWSVVRDNAAAEGKQVLSVKSANAGQTFNMLLSENAFPANLELAVKLRADSGEEDQGGGLVWRARDEKNYYITRWNPLESNLRIYKVEDGKRTQLQSARIEAPGGATWHTLGVRVHGAKMRVDFDGKALLEIEDATFTNPGKVGLWTKADASCSFDSLAIHPLQK